MTAKTWHTVNGTLFGFPELPTPEEMGEELHAKFTAANQSILEKAAKVKYRKPAKQRPWRGPKPGAGEFSPKLGEPGSAVTVTVCCCESVNPSDRTMPSHREFFTEEREGCVMFPARGARAVWVSLWDGRMPEVMHVSDDGSAGVWHMRPAEYVERFGPRAEIAWVA